MKRHHFEWKPFSKLVRNLYKISSIQTFILPILSSAVTYYCITHDIIHELDILVSFFFVWIFFVFWISMNYVNQRRFNAIDEIATIRGSFITILQIESVRKLETLADSKKISIDIMYVIKRFLVTKNKDESLVILYELDELLHKFTHDCELLRLQGFPAPEISRIQQFIFQIYDSIEKLKAIKDYRTPYTLKAFLYYALSLSTLMLAPHFAMYGNYGIWSAFVISFILSQILLIQNNIENPFIGFTDDINFSFIENLSKRIDKL